ncbi:MAG: c-type cytochrome domain-containing protein [Planctomycetota bacterium]
MLCVATARAAAPLSFATDIQPILERSCLPCHNATKAEGGLMLETPKLMEQGGDTGPAIKPNNALESLLFLTAAHMKKPFMPPQANKAKAPQLTSLQAEIIRKWIDEGALGEPKPKQPITWKSMPSAVQSISAVAVTSDGLTAAAGRGGDVTLYSGPLKRAVSTIKAHPDFVSALAFSPDGSQMVSGSYGEIKLWKKSAGIAPTFTTPLPAPTVIDPSKVPAEIKEETKAAAAVGVVAIVGTEEESRIIVGNADGKLNVWNRRTKKSVRTIQIGAPIKMLVASPDGKTVLVVAENKPVQCVNHIDGKIVYDLKADREATLRAAAINLVANGAAFEFNFLTAELKSTQDRISKLSDDLKKAEKEHADFSAKKAVNEKAFTEATTKRDALMKSRDESEDGLMASTAALEKAKTKEAEATAAALAADLAAKNATPASADDAKKVREGTRAAFKSAADARTAADKALVEASTKQKKSKQDFEEQIKTQLEAASQLKRGDAAEINAKNLAESIANLRTDEKALQASITLAKKTNDDATKVQTDFTQQSEKAPLAPVKALAFNTEFGVVLTEHTDGKIRAWNPDSGAPVDPADFNPKWELVKTIGNASSLDTPFISRVNAIAYSPDGKLIATGSGDPSRSGEIKLWDAATGTLVREIQKPHKDCVLTLDFSSNGLQLASGGADKAVRLWDVATGKLSRSLEAHSNHVLGVAFRHDSRRLVSASSDNSVKTWDLKTSDVLKTFADYTKEVNSIHYVGQSDTVLTTGGGPIVRVLLDGGNGGRTKTDGFPKFVTGSAVSRDGQIQVIGDVAGILRVINPDGKILAEWPATPEKVTKN